MSMRGRFKDQNLIPWSVILPVCSSFHSLRSWEIWVDTSENIRLIRRFHEPFHFAMQVKEKEISYKRLREENVFAQKVLTNIHLFVRISDVAVVQVQAPFPLLF
jgi:hypothetical protein